MSDFKPGQVAKATVRGVPDVRVMRFAEGDWMSAARVKDWWRHDDAKVTDARPLVVLDIEDPTTFVDWLRNGDTIKSHVVDAIADQIEAQTRPAIEEPKGLGAVVEDEQGTRWLRDEAHLAGPWWTKYARKVWADINVVRVLSEGVQ